MREISGIIEKFLSLSPPSPSRLFSPPPLPSFFPFPLPRPPPLLAPPSSSRRGRDSILPPLTFPSFLLCCHDFSFFPIIDLPATALASPPRPPLFSASVADHPSLLPLRHSLFVAVISTTAAPFPCPPLCSFFLPVTGASSPCPSCWNPPLLPSSRTQEGLYRRVSPPSWISSSPLFLDLTTTSSLPDPTPSLDPILLLSTAAVSPDLFLHSPSFNNPLPCPRYVANYLLRAQRRPPSLPLSRHPSPLPPPPPSQISR